MAQEARENDFGDPSRNVIRLVEDNTKRIDSELRRIDEKLADSFDQFKESASRETKRVDDNREADNRAVLTAANKAEVAATLLQGNVLTLAETLRKTMDTNAQALALQLTAMETKLSDRITVIEKGMAESKGSSGASNKLQMILVGVVVAVVEAVIIAVIFNVFKF